MTGTILLAIFNSLLYCACTSLIRFIYVRSSLKENIQRVLKRNSFTFSFLALGVFISIFNVAGELDLKQFLRTNDNQVFFSVHL